MDTEKMTNARKSVRLPDVGRPKIRPADEDSILSFKVSAALIKALDAEAEQMTRERPVGASKVSRSEALKILLGEILAAKAKARAERKQ
jgi:hypothetical protein